MKTSFRSFVKHYPLRCKPNSVPHGHDCMQQSNPYRRTVGSFRSGDVPAAQISLRAGCSIRLGRPGRSPSGRHSSECIITHIRRHVYKKLRLLNVYQPSFPPSSARRPVPIVHKPPWNNACPLAKSHPGPSCRWCLKDPRTDLAAHGQRYRLEYCGDRTPLGSQDSKSHCWEDRRKLGGTLSHDILTRRYRWPGA